MDCLPKRTNLVAETARTLKEWIGSGVLRETLPGELRLKERLKVSRDTLRLALRILEREGLVSEGTQGRQRHVQSKPAPSRRNGSTRDQPVCFLSPYPVLDRILLVELEELQRRLAEQRREMRFLSPKLFHLKNPEPHLRRLISENSAAAWILHQVGGRMQRWFEQHDLPAFVYGTPFPGVKLPYVVNDWESAAFHAGWQLMRHGHRVIGVLEFEGQVGAQVIERGLRRALSARPSDNAPLVFKNDRRPKSVARSLTAAFQLRERPTALVLNDSNQLLTCLSWMLSCGIGVPRDISLVCIPSDCWFQDMYPPVCHYKNNPKIFAHHLSHRVMELVETGRIAHKSVRVRLEYVPGASIGPAPDTTRRGDLPGS
jgi:DNA-binding LacI/PurR family transcriptional regulator